MKPKREGKDLSDKDREDAIAMIDELESQGEAGNVLSAMLTNDQWRILADDYRNREDEN